MAAMCPCVPDPPSTNRDLLEWTLRHIFKGRGKGHRRDAIRANFQRRLDVLPTEVPDGEAYALLFAMHESRDALEGYSGPFTVRVLRSALRFDVPTPSMYVRAFSLLPPKADDPPTPTPSPSSSDAEDGQI